MRVDIFEVKHNKKVVGQYLASQHERAAISAARDLDVGEYVAAGSGAFVLTVKRLRDKNTKIITVGGLLVADYQVLLVRDAK